MADRVDFQSLKTSQPFLSPRLSAPQGSAGCLANSYAEIAEGPVEESVSTDPQAESATTAEVESEASPALTADLDLEWFSFTESGVFVVGLSAEAIEQATDIVVGNITVEEGDALVGPNGNHGSV